MCFLVFFNQLIPDYCLKYLLNWSLHTDILFNNPQVSLSPWLRLISLSQFVSILATEASGSSEFNKQLFFVLIFCRVCLCVFNQCKTSTA